MTFYELLKTKYLHNIPTDEVESNTLQKIIETNIWPADYIELNGKMVHIYESNVKITDILDFFKVRMPWMKLQISNQELLDKEPRDIMAVKFVCFHQLAGLLSEVHSNFRKAFERIQLSDVGGAENEPTIH